MTDHLLARLKQALRFLDFQDDRKKAMHVVIFLTVLFFLLTVFVLVLPKSFIDLEFSEEVQEHPSPWLDALMKGVSWFGNQVVAISLTLGVALIFLLFKYKREALFVALTLLASVANFGLKVLVNRPRPTDDLVNVLVKAQHQSFPSGHTVFYVTFFGFLVYLMYRLRNIDNSLRVTVGVVSLLLIAAVPFSRVYLGAHWFTDVLAGFVFGLLCLAMLVYFYFGKSQSNGNENATLG